MKMNLATEINREKLAQVAAESVGKLENSNHPQAKRWINAIAKAVVEIESNPYLTFDVASHSLLILSERSGAIYIANGTCQCAAYTTNQSPCYHRALARLIVRYLETA